MGDGQRPYELRAVQTVQVDPLVRAAHCYPRRVVGHGETFHLKIIQGLQS